ncbi:hypothetical protein JCGZ_20222 [Jatropha curcas]|uniref:Uncharacterized protein n=1 Tax=Jatropha curcas TaxID=180498 RepID=A0A067JX74_JATCU|nr:hypothetical protein JCGZ_20222 [Jatropha curcas]
MRADEALDSELLMLYSEDFHSGMRLPLSEPLISFCNEYHLTISQMHPNGLSIICGLAELARQDGTQLTTRAIHALYMLRDQGREDFCFLQAQKKLHKGGRDIPNKWSTEPYKVKPKAINAMTMSYRRAQTLEDKIVEMEVEKVQLNDCIQLGKWTLTESNCKHQAKIKDLKLECSELEAKNKEQALRIGKLGAQVKQLEASLQEEEVGKEESLAQVCLNLQKKIIVELFTREHDKDWTFINSIYPKDEEESPTIAETREEEACEKSSLHEPEDKLEETLDAHVGLSQEVRGITIVRDPPVSHDEIE